MKESEYYVWRKGYGEPCKLHRTYYDALDECKRLATIHTEVVFYVIEVKADCVFNPHPITVTNYKG